MLKIDRINQSFSLLDTPTLADVSITERYDLQEFICNSPDAFFKELGLELFLLGKEIQASKNVQDRIDILAVDKEGCCVVIELKRGNHKLQMLQAISYAGMISQWESEDFLQLLNDQQQEALTEFLEVDRDAINRQQRIILIAEYPAPELATESVARGGKHRGTSKVKWPGWQAALAGISNAAVKSYFEQEVAAGRESYLRKRILRYRHEGKRRWFMAARTKNAYVWQQGRFDGDVDFWKSGLSDPEVVKPVKDGQCLRLFLDSAADFRFFHNAATQQLQLQSIEWHGGTTDESMDEPEPLGDE